MRFRRAVIVCVVLAALIFMARPYVHGLTFVIRVAEMQGAARRISDLDTSGGQERDITIPTARGPMRAGGWLALESGLALNRPVGLMGISFSGGLSIVAAGRPSLAGHVAYVFAFGGHDDLPRVLRYLCTGSEPYPAHELGVQSDRPFVLAPHDYGVAVILLGAADRVVPKAQVGP